LQVTAAVNNYAELRSTNVGIRE